MQLSTHAAQQPCRRSDGGPLLQHCTAATRTARPLPAQPRRPFASPLRPSPHAPPRTSPRLAAKLLDDGPYEGTSGCRSVQEVAAKAAAAVEVIRDRHANSLMFGPDSIDGHVLEVHVEATYNINAMRMGSPYRAERVSGSPDIRIYDVRQPDRTLELAQLKTHLRGINAAQYAGMEKVTTSDVAPTGGDVYDALLYGGVSSTPVDHAGLRRAAAHPYAHFESV